MALAVAKNPTVFRGDPIFEPVVGDPLPTELSGPFAVLVTPELARWILEERNTVNRSFKNKIAQFAADMVTDHWAYPTTSIIFDTAGDLKNGQNRLRAVIVAAGTTIRPVAVWMRFEFGWENGSLDVLDQGSMRSTPDTFRLHGIGDPNAVAAAVNMVHKYNETVGSSRSWMNSTQANYIPSPSTAIEEYESDEDAWRKAVTMGRRLHGRGGRGLDRSLTDGVWAAAVYILGKASPDLSVLFFEQVLTVEGPRSEAAQALRDYMMRRRVSDYRTKPADKREHLENILRAFKAHTTTSRVSFVRYPGFTLTRAPQIF